AGFDFFRPGNDKGFPDSAFMCRTFSPAIAAFEWASAVEPLRIRTGLKCSAIISHKQDKGIVINPVFLQRFYYFPYVFVQKCDHGRPGGMRISCREITSPEIRLLIAEFIDVIIYQPLRSL